MEAEKKYTLNQIRQSAGEVQSLINAKQYNLAMVKSRQTLELMVKHLSARANIAEADLIDSIDALYKKGWISKSTLENYHKIRIVGNKAIHESYHNSRDAVLLYQLIVQELPVLAQKRSSVKPRSAQPTRSKSRRKSVHRKKQTIPYGLLKLIIPVICIIIVIFAVETIHKKVTNKEESTTAATTEEVTLPVIPETAPPETETEPLPEYKASANLNVRKEASTDSERIATIPEGTAVEFKENYNDEWAVIIYDGVEAYVSLKYLSAE